MNSQQSFKPLFEESDGSEEKGSDNLDSLVPKAKIYKFKKSKWDRIKE